VYDLCFENNLRVLKIIYPQFGAGRILRGLANMHAIEMFMLSISAWTASLMFQSTYAGMDMTLEFAWQKCKDEANSTWLGGFQWECYV